MGNIIIISYTMTSKLFFSPVLVRKIGRLDNVKSKEDDVVDDTYDGIPLSRTTEITLVGRVGHVRSLCMTVPSLQKRSVTIIEGRFLEIPFTYHTVFDEKPR